MTSEEKYFDTRYYELAFTNRDIFFKNIVLLRNLKSK